MNFTYEKNGAEIYRSSFAIIRSEAKLGDVSPVLERVLVRMIHACGMVDIAADVVTSAGAAEIGRAALANGARILCDAQMIASGITRSRLSSENDIVCTLSDPAVANISQRLMTTRSAAAVELWQGRIDGSVIAIGNAPTALFHLLELLARCTERPALILGLPVGFVGAAESKEALAANAMDIPYITLRGRRGGSAIATAAINALARDEE